MRLPRDIAFLWGTNLVIQPDPNNRITTPTPTPHSYHKHRRLLWYNTVSSSDLRKSWSQKHKYKSSYGVAKTFDSSVFSDYLLCFSTGTYCRMCLVSSPTSLPSKRVLHWCLQFGPLCECSCFLFNMYCYLCTASYKRWLPVRPPDPRRLHVMFSLHSKFFSPHSYAPCSVGCTNPVMFPTWWCIHPVPFIALPVHIA